MVNLEKIRIEEQSWYDWFLFLDTRDIDEERRNKVIEKLHESAIKIAQRRQVKLSEFKIVNQDPPALSEVSIISAMENAAMVSNLSYKFMISRAYHDSLFMSRYTDIQLVNSCYYIYSNIWVLILWFN